MSASMRLHSDVSNGLPLELKPNVGPSFMAALNSDSESGPIMMQGWLMSRERKLKIWHRRWCVAKSGQMDVYDDIQSLTPRFTLPLSECRLEKEVVRESALQAGCDFDYGFRVIHGQKNMLGLASRSSHLFAAATRQEMDVWGSALLSCRHKVLESQELDSKIGSTIKDFSLVSVAFFHTHTHTLSLSLFLSLPLSLSLSLYACII